MTADLTPSIRAIDLKAADNAKELERARNGLKHARSEVERFEATVGILEEIDTGYNAAIATLRALVPAEEPEDDIEPEAEAKPRRRSAV